MNPAYPLVAERAGHRCEYCRAPEAIFNLPFEVEHIVPLAKQGAHEPSNWALACRVCNLHKSEHVEGLDPATREVVRLFHPRQDLWAEHFDWDAKSPVQLHARTPIGRATLERLRMNAPLQLAARAHWIELGLFP